MQLQYIKNLFWILTITYELDFNPSTKAKPKMSSKSGPRSKIATQMTSEHRTELARLVRDNKEILIGKFTPSVTQKSRDQKWTDIYTHLTGLGAVVEDVNMLRFTVYPNISKATRRKRDQAKSTGQGPPNWTELDEIILDIIGRDSAAAIGIAGATQEDDVIFGSDNTTTLLDDTTESIFRTPLPGSSVQPKPPVFAVRSVPLFPQITSPVTSSPIKTTGEVNNNSSENVITPNIPLQQSRSVVKKRRAGQQTSILVDEDYKQLRVQKMQLDIEEQNLRMEYMRVQIEAEKRRSEAETSRRDFFRLAGLSLTGRQTMVIKSDDGTTNFCQL